MIRPRPGGESKVSFPLRRESALISIWFFSLGVKDQDHAEPNDEVTDGRMCRLKPTPGGTAIELGGFPRAATNDFPANRIGRGSLGVGHGAAWVIAIPILTPFPNIALHV